MSSRLMPKEAQCYASFSVRAGAAKLFGVGRKQRRAIRLKGIYELLASGPHGCRNVARTCGRCPATT